jgi:hypothetical protein
MTECASPLSNSLSYVSSRSLSRYMLLTVEMFDTHDLLRVDLERDEREIT